jgi:small subunit ribosomal protein S16
MAVRIRLKRMGSKRKPFYRFIVVDSRGKRDGGFLDQVGYYNPISQPHDIKVDEEKLADWLGKGAQMSDGARSLLKKAGFLGRLERGAGGEAGTDEAVEEAGAQPTGTETAVAEPGETEPEKEGETESDAT